MGGRIHGFLGGALLTSAFVYYTGEYIKKDQQFISRQLRIADTVINEGIISGKDIHNHGIPIEPRGKKDVHTGVLETSKDIWNEEIINMVNWVYSINWYDAFLKLDQQYDKLTNKIANNMAGNHESAPKK